MQKCLSLDLSMTNFNNTKKTWEATYICFSHMTGISKKLLIYKEFQNDINNITMMSSLNSTHLYCK